MNDYILSSAIKTSVRHKKYFVTLIPPNSILILSPTGPYPITILTLHDSSNRYLTQPRISINIYIFIFKFFSSKIKGRVGI